MGDGGNIIDRIGDLVKGAKFVKGESEDEAATKRMEIINKPRKKKPNPTPRLPKKPQKRKRKRKKIRKTISLLKNSKKKRKKRRRRKPLSSMLPCTDTNEYKVNK